MLIHFKPAFSECNACSSCHDTENSFATTTNLPMLSEAGFTQEQDTATTAGPADLHVNSAFMSAAIIEEVVVVVVVVGSIAAASVIVFCSRRVKKIRQGRLMSL